MDDQALIRLTTDIVVKAIAAQNIAANEVPDLLKNVHAALHNAANPAPDAPQAEAPRVKRKRRTKAEMAAAAEAAAKMAPVDEKEADEQLLDDLTEASQDGTISEGEDGDALEITLGDNGEIQIPKKRPEPMFQD
jgi:hypothetical protein